MQTPDAMHIEAHARGVCAPTTAPRREAVAARALVCQPFLAGVFALSIYADEACPLVHVRTPRSCVSPAAGRAGRATLRHDRRARRAGVRDRWCHAVLHQCDRTTPTRAGQQGRQHHAAGHGGRALYGQPAADPMPACHAATNARARCTARALLMAPTRTRCCAGPGTRASR